MRVLLLFALLLGLGACVQQEQPGSKEDLAKAAPSTPELELASLQKTLAAQEKRQQALREEIANLQIQLLEKEALITGLQRDNQQQQQRLDSAIVEVVRAKAKLRSLESKADAASTIAETEIALKTLKNLVAEGQDNPMEISQAEELLEMSSEEFKKQNFGGALYLAGQAKTQIRMGRMALGGASEITVIEGEVLFVQPLPLVVLKKSNLRSGPDINQKVLTQLEKGTSVVGYSYKGLWVRVETDAKQSGWIYQSLVSAP